MTPERTTRHCLDPWRNVEIGTFGEVSPCCVHPPLGHIDTASASGILDRDSDAFRQLRESLLTGNLTEPCGGCHIRPLAPLKSQRQAVRSAKGVVRGALLAAGALESMRIDVTRDCNLRCVYCAVSQQGYVGGQMPAEVFDAALKLIPAEAGGLRIDLNGHGETTTHPDWLRMARAATESGASVTMLSNFAKPFDADEIGVLATMSVIQISLDTTDDALLKRLRRKVSLGNILRNLHLIRMRARKADLKPEWAISCGVYDKSVASLRDLAWFAVTAGFDSVTFWNLVKYPDILDPGTARVKPIADLPEDEQRKAVAALSDAIRILEDHGVKAEVAGDFVDWPSGRWSRTG
ncbi:MAG: hypothetical protein A2X92_10155 [Syntrophus sp. GWC2_56_31]|nr:MAG: hypothetical protein A2X92_10155 [Syntrophus sp. GWC2_56_31]